jgi:hypothetical protein
MGLPLVLAAIGTVASISAANSAKKASKAAEQKAKEVGMLEAQQSISDMFLGRAQAIERGDQRLRELELSESQNLAMFSAMGRDDRSVDAFLKNNRALAGEDIGRIARGSELQQAKRITEAVVSKEYGQSSAAGIRAQGNANYMSNIASIAKNFPIDLLPKQGQLTSRLDTKGSNTG